MVQEFSALEAKSLTEEILTSGQKKQELAEQHKLQQAQENLPKLLNKILKQIKKVSGRGQYYILYEGPFFNFGNTWNEITLGLLRDELELRHFQCDRFTQRGGPLVLRISWRNPKD